MRVIDFSDKTTPYGWFYAQHADEVPAGWWTARNESLGESPFSALCDARFSDVLDALEAEAGKR